MARRAFGLVVVALGLAVGAASLSAQAVRVGGQVSFADDADFGIGPKLMFHLPNLASGLWLSGSFDFFFPDDGFGSVDDVDYYEINANLIYEIDLPAASNVAPYLGAGLNLAHLSITEEMGGLENSDTDLGLNVLAGLNFPLVGFTPFVEIRLEIEGGEQFVIAGGIMLP